MNKQRSILIALFLLVALTALYAFFVERKEGMRGKEGVKNMISNMKQSLTKKMQTMKTNKKTNDRLKAKEKQK